MHSTFPQRHSVPQSLWHPLRSGRSVGGAAAARGLGVQKCARGEQRPLAAATDGGEGTNSRQPTSVKEEEVGLLSWNLRSLGLCRSNLHVSFRTRMHPGSTVLRPSTLQCSGAHLYAKLMTP